MKIHELFAAMWAMWLRGQPPPLHTSVNASPVGAGNPPQHVQVSSKGLNYTGPGTYNYIYSTGIGLRDPYSSYKLL